MVRDSGRESFVKKSSSFEFDFLSSVELRLSDSKLEALMLGRKNLSWILLSCRLNMLDGSTDFDLPMCCRFDCGSAGVGAGLSSKLSIEDEALMSLLFRFSFLGGGTGAAGNGAGGETDLDELILSDPVLCSLSFSVSSFSRSVLLADGFLSGDDEADDEDFLPNPNFLSVFRLDLSMVVCKREKCFKGRR